MESLWIRLAVFSSTGPRRHFKVLYLIFKMNKNYIGNKIFMNELQMDQRRVWWPARFVHMHDLNKIFLLKNWIHRNKVIITENGWSDRGELEDDDRIQYHHDHFQQMLDVVLNSECNLKGYAAWSIIDNFEWTSGYT